MTVAEMEGPPFGVFTDNWPAASLFAQLGTQWRIGFNGKYTVPTGLDFNVLYQRMDRLGLAPDAYAELEDQIMTMETVALKTMSEQRT